MKKIPGCPSYKNSCRYLIYNGTNVFIHNVSNSTALLTVKSLSLDPEKKEYALYLYLILFLRSFQWDLNPSFLCLCKCFLSLQETCCQDQLLCGLQVFDSLHVLKLIHMFCVFANVLYIGNCCFHLEAFWPFHTAMNKEWTRSK